MILNGLQLFKILKTMYLPQLFYQLIIQKVIKGSKTCNESLTDLPLMKLI